MRKIVIAGVIAVFAGLVMAPPSEARRGGHGHRGHGHHHHGHRHGHVHSSVFFGFGPSFYYGPYYRPYWYSGYYYPSAVYAPPPVVVQEPPVYIQQPPAMTVPETAPSAEQFWHYCTSAGAYYPTAPTCPEQWIKVPPRP
jgi:hypothetical protein